MTKATDAVNETAEVVRDGLELHVRIDRPYGDEDRPKHAVLMMHGLLGDSGYADGNLLQELADRFVANDWIVVRFDFNGHGKSEGDFAAADLYNETEDAIAVLDYVRGRDDVRDIALLGHSAGAVVAGMLAGMYPDVVRGLAMLSPAASLKDDAMRGLLLGVSFDPVHVPETIAVADGRVTIDGKFVRIARTLPVYEMAARFHGPALAIQGDRDTVITEACAKQYGAAMTRCAVSTYSDLTHAFDGADRDVAEAEAVQFLLALD
ncbi:alpha/beta hydrolase [Bifidobacterium choloepi]|uniref:Alpha/beta fold hydrolase n=1 Tax=Bifidobacterium choloepi TaxID=2614131 RepID=A0A6I5N3E2_9BIFI|nr:alpha/beta fold hydrolase [Bifidobacterium choloepi]NEG70189.1 alpha/beta fold hydrolase [Bifidobacterium choloepi]